MDHEIDASRQLVTSQASPANRAGAAAEVKVIDGQPSQEDDEKIPPEILEAMAKLTVGGVVRTHARRSKEKLDEKRARVLKLLTKTVRIQLLEGKAKDWVTVMSPLSLTPIEDEQPAPEANAEEDGKKAAEATAAGKKGDSNASNCSPNSSSSSTSTSSSSSTTTTTSGGKDSKDGQDAEGDGAKETSAAAVAAVTAEEDEEQCAAALFGRPVPQL